VSPYGFRPGFWREHEVNEKWRPNGYRRSSSPSNVQARRADRRSARQQAREAVAVDLLDASYCIACGDREDCGGSVECDCGLYPRCRVATRLPAPRLQGALL
jgi:hypothetical protein